MVDEVRTYSLQSEKGHHECSLSALRWICKEKVHFQYHYSSWQDRMRNPLFTQCMPAGPLLDITVRVGTMEEIQLPHWICIGNKKTMSSMFAVLHADTCGDVVEEVSEVTSSYVKLLHPVFSPRGAVDNEEESDGFRRIRKPGPDKSLQLESYYFLTTDPDTAEINPEKRTLTSERRNYSTDFFEVFVESAKHDFHLTLKCEKKRSKKRETVWTCIIRTNEYQNESYNNRQGEHFVDIHWVALIQRVHETGAILDRLLEKKIISREIYDRVIDLKPTQKQMREILKFVTSAGRHSKDVFLQILRRMPSLRPLMSELGGLQ